MNETQTTNISEILTTDVLYTQDSSFLVTVPKKITIEDTKTSTYEVEVLGNISSAGKVMVVPEESFFMKDIATIGTPKNDVEV